MTFDERIEYLMQSIASHDRQIAELVENGARLDARLAVQTTNIDKLVEVTNRDAINIAALARVAEAHERRIDRIEGTQE